MFNLQGKDSDKYFKEVEDKLEETNYLLELKQSQEVVAACKKIENLVSSRVLPGIFFRKDNYNGLDVRRSFI
jgi:hypothetical protein